MELEPQLRWYQSPPSLQMLESEEAYMHVQSHGIFIKATVRQYSYSTVTVQLQLPLQLRVALERLGSRPDYLKRCDRLTELTG
eukprot:3704826-Pyramimonas_sp.AAC.2